MPLYEFYCPQCKEKFESLREISRRLSALCPKCNTKSKLVLSSFSFKFPTRIDQADGEGFSSRDVSHRELEEMRQV